MAVLSVSSLMEALEGEAFFKELCKRCQPMYVGLSLCVRGIDQLFVIGVTPKVSVSSFFHYLIVIRLLPPLLP